MSLPDDHLLLASAQSGDRVALERLWERHRRGVAAVLLLFSAAVSAQDRARFDIASFDLPEGWSKAPVVEVLRLQPPANDAHVDVARSVPISASIDEHGAALVAAAEKLPDYRIEVAPQSGPHRRSSGRWHRFVFSYADPERAGQFLYVAKLSVAAGDRCVSFSMVTATVAAYDAHRAVLGTMVDGVVLSSGQRLERGSPPLTRFMVDESIDFLEWLVQSPMTDDQKATVETELRRYWKQKLQTEIDGIRELLSARVELARMDEERRELARQAVLVEVLAAWRADAEDAGAKLMLSIYDASHAPIAAGEPPLTRQAVEAFAEFLNFAAGKTIGYDGKLPKSTRDQLVAGVAEGYAELPTEQRELITSMPMVWAALRVAWPDLSPEQQQEYIDGWKRSESIAALGEAMAAQKRAADELREAAEGMRELQQRQAMMRGQQMHFEMMQNIMRMQQDTMRIMTSNLGGNTRYEYRW